MIIAAGRNGHKRTLEATSRYPLRRSGWRASLTVCAAAISLGTIIGASDRMLTSGAGDIEFEPQVSKLRKVTENVCVMVAGDITLQTEILHKMGSAIPSLPRVTWSVEEVANAYYEAYIQVRSKRIDWAILRPLGLQEASDVLLRGEVGMRIASDMLNFKMPIIEAIVTGHDESGPHIYVVDNQSVTCQDWVGFASIGGGSGHANSQFMFAGHNRYKPLPETLMLVYSAKKRAEVAPGVGDATDMFLIEPPGTFVTIGTHVLEQLDDSYRELEYSAATAMEAAYGKIAEYIRGIVEAPEQPEGDGPPAPPALPVETQGLPRADEP